MNIACHRKTIQCCHHRFKEEFIEKEKRFLSWTYEHRLDDLRLLKFHMLTKADGLLSGIRVFLIYILFTIINLRMIIYTGRRGYCFKLIYYMIVSQRLGTTEFTNLIG